MGSNHPPSNPGPGGPLGPGPGPGPGPGDPGFQLKPASPPKADAYYYPGHLCLKLTAGELTGISEQLLY